MTGRFVAGPQGPLRVTGLVLVVFLGALVAGIVGATVGLMAFAVVVAVAALAQRRTGTGTGL